MLPSAGRARLLRRDCPRTLLARGDARMAVRVRAGPRDDPIELLTRHIRQQRPQLGLLQHFFLEQAPRNLVQHRAIRREQFFNVTVALADDALHLFVHRRRRRLREVALRAHAHLASQEDVAVVPEEHRADALAHAPARHHLAGQIGDVLEVVLRARGDLADRHLLRDAPAQPHSDAREQVVARIVVAGRSGLSTTTWRSKRPGRSSAGSSTSGRLVAASTMTAWRGSKPSISTRIWLRVCSRSSLPPPRPAPRWRPTASSSSMKMMQGAAFLARSKRSRTRLAPTPTSISTNSEPDIE